MPGRHLKQYLSMPRILPLMRIIRDVIRSVWRDFISGYHLAHGNVADISESRNIDVVTNIPIVPYVLDR